MEGKGPYHIYDPGGATREEAAKAFERLVEENTRLKEKMQGIKSLGELLEESHVEASKLRQKVEDLVKDNKMLQPSPFPSDELLEVTGRDPDGNMTSAEPSRSEKEQDAETRPTPLSGSSSEFEIVPTEDKRFSQESRKSDTEKPQHEDANLMLHLQRLESTLSVFAEEADRNQVLAHLGRMALEFNRLASKVHRNEQRTSVLQTLCEQLRNENEDLRAKLEKDLEQRNQVTEKLRCENQELRKMVLLRKEGAKGDGVERCSPQQSGATAEKASGKGTSEASEKKVKILEHQRNELLEVNKQWDQHFRAMKQQYEQKITDLRHKLADAQKALGEQEVEREQKQRDFDRKLLLAKSRIEVEEAEKERLSAEVKELKQRTRFLQEQLAPVTKQRGKVNADKSVEIEAVRILVPKAAITHVVATKNAKLAKSGGHPKGETLCQLDGAEDAKKELLELKNAIEKLKNSERRLLQDKEGLSNQLRVQTEVNRELKKLLVASVGDDLQYHFERMAREKNQLILENEALGRNMSQLSEQLERMSIQCDVWRSKFLASRVMADELTNARAILQRQTRDAQSAIQDLLSERDQFRQEMIDAQKVLEELLVSLQWGRQQTYYPSAQPHTTAELAAVNHKLAKAVSSHLLGNMGTSSPKKTSLPAEFCNTPAEKMAEMVLRVLDPAACTETPPEVPFSESSPSSFLSAKKNIGRFHPYTRYENITFNCCNHCQGELIAL